MVVVDDHLDADFADESGKVADARKLPGIHDDEPLHPVHLDCLELPDGPGHLRGCLGQVVPQVFS